MFTTIIIIKSSGVSQDPKKEKKSIGMRINSDEYNNIHLNLIPTSNLIRIYSSTCFSLLGKKNYFGNYKLFIFQRQHV